MIFFACLRVFNSQAPSSQAGVVLQESGDSPPQVVSASANLLQLALTTSFGRSSCLRTSHSELWTCAEDRRDNRQIRTTPPSGVVRGLLQGRPLQLPMGWGVGKELTKSWPTFEQLCVQNLAWAISYCLSPRAHTKSGWLEVGQELDMGCQLLCHEHLRVEIAGVGLSCSNPLATPKTNES